MIVSDVYKGVTNVTGSCNEADNFDYLRRALQLLGNQGLFDPLLAYGEFSVDNGYHVALPRDVKTILKLNIDGNPSFRRSRFFEFTQNTNGSVEGEEVGWSWADKLYSPIQNELPLPGQLCYIADTAGDIGKKVKIIGKREDGFKITETILATESGEAAAPTVNVFHSIDQVTREETTNYATLYTAQSYDDGDTEDYLALWSPGDTSPRFRVIKVSKTNVDVRIMFRREVLRFTSQDDILPFDSEYAIIQACNALKLLDNSQFDDGKIALALAVDIAKQEQASRDEGESMAAATELPTATDTGINSRDSLIVADVYDDACDIFGPIGRSKIFDKITTVIEMLTNQANWDAGVGIVDLYPPDQTELLTFPNNGKGSGYFVMPRFVETILALRIEGRPYIPRNRWFEYNVNAWPGTDRSQVGYWEDMGEVVTCARLAIDETTRRVRPAPLAVIANAILDIGAEVVVFGKEYQDGQIVEVIRGGVPGYRIAAQQTSPPVVAGDAPLWVQIDRIVKPVTKDFMRLYSLNGTALDVMLGYWYPDEIEPRYKAIKIPTAKPGRLSIRFRRRFEKVTSFYEPIFLRSRVSIIAMMRSLASIGIPAESLQHEAIALKHMTAARINEFPSDTPDIQFDAGSMPGCFQNVT